MRFKVRVAAAALVAMLVCAVAASAASASTAPEFKPEGEHTFSDTFGGTIWKDTKGDVFTYSGGSFSGKIPSANEIEGHDKELKEVTLTFTGGSHICENGAAGELTLTKLRGYLGYTRTETDQVGLILFSEKGILNAMGKCTKGEYAGFEITGALILPMEEAALEKKTHILDPFQLEGEEFEGTHFDKTGEFWVGGYGGYIGVNVPFKLKSKALEEGWNFAFSGEIPLTSGEALSVGSNP
jgi:hypothetical protein